MFKQAVIFGLAVVGFGGLSQASVVWQSTFDADVDGVEDLRDNNSGKVMIGPVADGRLEILAWDNGTDAYTPDKAGRPLDATKGAADSFSGLYEFSWTTYNSDEPQAFEVAGFLGNNSAQTRQVLGALLRHWRVQETGNYYVAIDLLAASSGWTVQTGYIAGSPILLGSQAADRDFQLAIGYDGDTKVLSAALFELNSATPLGEIERDIRTLYGFSSTSSINSELNDFALTHLGWSDYSGTFANRPTVWSVDSLTLFDTADGAYTSAAVPEPGAALAAATMSFMVLRTRRHAMS